MDRIIDWHSIESTAFAAIWSEFEWKNQSKEKSQQF